MLGSTPFSEIYLRFKDTVGQSTYDSIDIITRKSYIRLATVSFLSNVRLINVDYDIQEFKEELNEIEMSLLSLYMYDSHLDQELKKANKLTNIVSDSFKISGVQDKVNNIEKFKLKNQEKINILLASLM